ncbi:MAG: hypothetical protein M1840_002566 [Geoglossum simile]|nr:MAG: hypothetical protein M1840_002566 [Geoglossum simile]
MSSPDYKAMFLRAERLRLEAEDAAHRNAQAARQAEEAATEKIQETERRAAAEIAARDQLLEDKDRKLKDKDRKLEDKDRKLEDKDRKLEDKDRKLEEEQLRRAQAELLTRPTTLTEYLDLCHTHLFNPITIQTDKTLSSQGDGTTSNTDKIRPTRLRHWDPFSETHQSIIERLLDKYPSCQPRVFEHRAFLQTYGDRVGSRRLACEPDLQSLERETVETPVTKIIDHLHTLADVCEEFHLTSKGITFYSHPNPLSDGTEEVIQQLQRQSFVPSTPPRYPSPSTQPTTTPFTILKPDQICVYSITSGDNVQRKLAFVIEYKPPHKVTSPILRLGFRDMDVADIINCQIIPTDKEARFRYHADRIIASIATQTFAYMIQGGVQYGYITTGVGFVFLYIPSDDPGTLYYHLSEPRNDVDAQKTGSPDTKDYIYQTAVSQVTAFSLLALETQGLRSDIGDSPWQLSVIKSLNTWKVDFRDIWKDMPDNVRSSPPASPYIGRTSGTAGSPKRLRPRDSSGRVCAPPTKPIYDNEHSDQSDSELQKKQGNAPSQSRGNRKTGNSYKTGRSSSKTTTASSSQAGQRSRSYCSQHCLRGLVNGWLLDSACPNISDHRGLNNKATRHQLSHTAFLDLLRAQLARSLDGNCLPLGFQGARGALFKVTLASHGYTMVAKGTVLAFVKDLRWESQIYQQLTPIQGLCVPVWLGSIDLVNPYYYDMGVRIIHLMLLSWAGDCFIDDGGDEKRDRSELVKEIARSVKAIHRAGVLHRDMRRHNICWNSELGGIMIIDFERSELLRGQGPPFSPPSSLRRPLPPTLGDQRKKMIVMRKRTLAAKRSQGASHSTSAGGSSSSDDTRLAQEVLQAKRTVVRCSN